MLLKTLSVMVTFLGIFQEFNKNNFQFQKHLRGVASQAYRWYKYVCDRSKISFSS